jgi:hypothetical protein
VLHLVAKAEYISSLEDLQHVCLVAMLFVVVCLVAPAASGIASLDRVGPTPTPKIHWL